MPIFARQAAGHGHEGLRVDVARGEAIARPLDMALSLELPPVVVPVAGPDALPTLEAPAPNRTSLTSNPNPGMSPRPNTRSNSSTVSPHVSPSPPDCPKHPNAGCSARRPNSPQNPSDRYSQTPDTIAAVRQARFHAGKDGGVGRDSGRVSVRVAGTGCSNPRPAALCSIAFRR